MSRTIGLLSLLALLSGCAASQTADSPTPMAKDFRLGPPVSQVCFASSMQGWSNIRGDRHALVIHMPRKRAYRLELSGACEPDMAMARIAVINRTGSSCLSTGDRIATDAQRRRGNTCSIIRINEWYPEMPENPTPQAAEM